MSIIKSETACNINTVEIKKIDFNYFLGGKLCWSKNGKREI